MQALAEGNLGRRVGRVVRVIARLHSRERSSNMQRSDIRTWMLSDAVDALRAVERLQRQFFHLGESGEGPSWEPPVDMYDSGLLLAVLVALPGVAQEHIDVSMEPGAIVVRGRRPSAPHFEVGEIVRLEIPYGRFERRIPLPAGVFQLTDVLLQQGCLRLQLERLS